MYYALELSVPENGPITIENVTVQFGMPSNNNIQTSGRFYQVKVFSEDKRELYFDLKFDKPKFKKTFHIFNENGTLETTTVYGKVEKFMITLPIFEEGDAGIYNEDGAMLISLNLSEFAKKYYEKKLELEQAAEALKIETNKAGETTNEVVKLPISDGTILYKALENVALISIASILVIIVILSWIFVFRKLGR